MKKLLTICLIMATIFTVNAQDKKPTKEETIAYLDKVLKMSVGYNNYRGEAGNRSSQLLITDYIFSEKEIQINYKVLRILKESTHFESQKFSKIPWENVDKIFERDNKDFNGEELSTIEVVFSTKLRYDAEVFNKEVGMDENDHYPNYIQFYVFNDKKESFKKALGRLVEIAKEENKDPFKD